MLNIICHYNYIYFYQAYRLEESGMGFSGGLDLNVGRGYIFRICNDSNFFYIMKIMQLQIFNFSILFLTRSYFLNIVIKHH